MAKGDQRALEIFFRNYPGSFARCWAPGNDCPNEAIRAHSIQNAQAIEFLAEKNHVVAAMPKFGTSGPSVEFSEVGRNRASTFHGLCSKHDAEIFSPIETRPISLDEPLHLFLLAYRAVIRELQVCSRAGVMAQRGYIDRVEAGLDPKDTPTPTGIFAMSRLMVAYETAMFKSAFDDAYLGQRYDGFEHDVLTFERCRPSIAASALFSLADHHKNSEALRVTLTVLPLTESVTAAVLSYPRKSARRARAGLAEVLKSKGQKQQLALSRYVLNHVENFILAPSFFNSWPAEKKDAVQNYFVRTLLSDDLTTNRDDLNLFWPEGEPSMCVTDGL